MLAQSQTGNVFLAELPAPDFALLRPHLVPSELRINACLHNLGHRIENVVFPHSGLVTLTIPLRDGAGAGITLVGRDGVVGGCAVAASAPATCDAEVYVGGQASQMSACAFRYALEESPSIRRLAAKFDTAMLAQVQQAALCNAAHPVEARICRLLVEIQDRTDLDRIPLTQAALARMLSVRRTTVTLMAGRLEAAGLINCRRGYVEIVRRDELEQRCCECYDCLRHSRLRLFAGTPKVAAAADAVAGESAGLATV